jgi:uncharacterized protein YcnI
MNAVRRLTISIGAVGAGALMLAAAASAHAIMSPAVAKAGNTLQQFTLSVPTEEAGQTTTKIELTVPSTFSIDSFEPPPAPWKMQTQTSGSGNSAVVTKVTWTGGKTPTNLDSVFRFNASIAKPGTTLFNVRQTYSSGKIVDWTAPSESADTPAPRVEALSSFGGGGGTSIVAIIALILGAAALLLAGVGLFGGKRQIA